MTNSVDVEPREQLRNGPGCRTRQPRSLALAACASQSSESSDAMLLM